MERREPSYTVSGNVSWCSHYGKQYGGSSKSQTELPYDPAIPLLSIYSDKTIIQKDMRIPMFTTALFTIARTWKQSKCPWADEWIKMWYIYAIALVKNTTISQGNIIIISQGAEKLIVKTK